MKLFYRIDSLAAFRDTGKGKHPDPVVVAALSELEQVDGFSAYLSADRRPMSEKDLKILLDRVSIPVNLIAAPTTRNRDDILELRPASITLIQESASLESTFTPFDVDELDHARSFIKAMNEADIQVGVLIRPSSDGIKQLTKANINRAVLDLSDLSRRTDKTEQSEWKRRLDDCIKISQKVRMELQGWGGLDFGDFASLRSLPLSTCHVGHAITARAVLVGILESVRQFRSGLIKG